MNRGGSAEWIRRNFMVSVEWYRVVSCHVAGLLGPHAAFQVGCGSCGRFRPNVGTWSVRYRHFKRRCLTFHIHTSIITYYGKHLCPATQHGHKFLTGGGPHGAASQYQGSGQSSPYQLESPFSGAGWLEDMYTCMSVSS